METLRQSRFDTCLGFVLAREGGYVDDPDDRGGATNQGVTQKVYDQHRRGLNIAPRSVREITADEVAAIYHKGYWKPTWCDVLPEPLDLVLFDSAVNHGPRQAALFLQRALGVDADGAIGRMTMSAVREEVMAGKIDSLVEDIIGQREEFYDALVARHPEQKKFRKGWANRLVELGWAAA